MRDDNVALFAQLAGSHREKLYRVAYRMTGNADDAQDLVQDALLEAFRSFRNFRPGTYFDKWLYRIITNTFIDRQRQRKRTGSAVSLDSALEGEGDSSGLDIPDWESNPEGMYLKDVLSEQLQAALDSLPPEFRMVLILADVEEFSYEEIGEMMGSPVGTVRSRLHRARSLVRSRLRN
ncbi:MAG: sigma-70 family RNA polymerase sigma factor [Capsulimonadaceae bacterium]